MLLRIEVYSLDGIENESIPYTTTQHTCFIQFLQPQLNNKYGIFLATESEALTYTYERNPADPRISHSINIETDEFGNTLKAATISYGRINPDSSLTTDERVE
jgi:hypothetical protein